MGSGVGVAAGVGLGVAVGLGVGVGVGVTPGTAGEARFCGPGVPEMNQSVALSFVSVALPAAPPGRRSRLDDAGGAAIGDALDEGVGRIAPADRIDHGPADDPKRDRPTGRGEPAGVRRVPRRRRYEPAPFTTRIRRPGARIVDALHVALRVTVDPLDVA